MRMRSIAEIRSGSTLIFQHPATGRTSRRTLQVTPPGRMPSSHLPWAPAFTGARTQRFAVVIRSDLGGAACASRKNCVR